MLDSFIKILSSIPGSKIFASVIAILIASTITAIVTYYIRKKNERGLYFPDTPQFSTSETYEDINGEWHLYHFTKDSKLSSDSIITHSTFELVLEKNLIVSGEENVQFNHRKALKYLIRGQIRSGQFLFTAICTQDSSEIYTGMFPNLLDDEALGVILAKDYQRELYCSPALIIKNKITTNTAKKKLSNAPVNMYG